MLAAIAIVIGVVVSLEVLRTGALNDDRYRIDEAHKVADTFFMRLLLERRLSDPAWFDHPVDRSNPPAGKYLFGLAALLSGAELPQTLSIRRLNRDGSLTQELESAAAARYQSVLASVRRVSLVATALTAALLFLAASSIRHWLAGVVAVLFYMLHYLTLNFATTAVYDALLTLFVTATLIPLLMMFAHPHTRARSLLCGLSAGSLCALAFQTRVTGLAALAAYILTTGFLMKRIRVRQFLIAATSAAVLCLILGTMINPFYWSAASGENAAVRANEDPLPVRILHRYELQFADLKMLASQEAARQQPLTSPGKRISFVAEILLGGWVGMVNLLCAGMALIFLFLRPEFRRGTGGVLILWCAIILLLFLLWLPFPWPRYVLVMVPPFAMIGALGLSELLFGSRRRPTSSPADP